MALSVLLAAYQREMIKKQQNTVCIMKTQPRSGFSAERDLNFHIASKMLKRPNPKETEEDLLLQQQEFLRRRSAGQAGARSMGSAPLQDQLKRLQVGGRGKSHHLRHSVMSPVVEHNYPESAYDVGAPLGEGANRKPNKETRFKQEDIGASPAEANGLNSDRRWTLGGLSTGKLESKLSPKGVSEQERRTMFADILRMKEELCLSPSNDGTLNAARKQSENSMLKRENEESIYSSRFLDDASVWEVNRDFSINRFPTRSTVYYSCEDVKSGVNNENPDALKSFTEFRAPALPTDSFYQGGDRPNRKSLLPCASNARSARRRRTTFAKQALPFELPSQRRFSLIARPKEIEAIKLEVHRENEALLANMSEKEIVELRNQILGKAKPSLEILKSLTSGRKLLACEAICKAEEARKASEDVALPFNVDPSWLNMGVIEKDKLEWMSDLPTDTDFTKEVPTWRFDLEGNLLPFNAHVSVQRGLHHHGEESQRAGYNIKELLCLTRSSVLSQRILAVSTLAKIAEKATATVFKSSTSPPVFEELRNANALVLVRLCFDDRACAMLSACLRFFEAVLCRPSEEELLDFTLECCGGFTQPWLRPVRSKESKNLSDDEVFKADAVEGLVRTQFLQRLDSVFRDRLIKLSSPAVGGPTGATMGTTVLNILCRMARHSLKVCNQVIACDAILQNCLADCLSDEQNTIFPRGKFIKLVRILSCADRSIAAQLVQQASILRMVLQIVAAEPGDLGISESVACNLICECYRYWRCVISYGLELQNVRNLHNVIVDQIRQACDLAGGDLDLSQPHFSFIRLRLIVATLESYLIASRDTCRAEAVSVANRSFRSLALSMYRIVCKCTDNGLSGVHASYSTLLAAMFNYFATAARFGVQSLFDPQGNCLAVAMKRFGASVASAAGDLARWSFFLQPNEGQVRISSDWISPPMGVDCLIDVEGRFSPFPLCASWTRLLYYAKLPCCQELFTTMTDCKPVRTYLAEMTKSKGSGERSLFFARFETYFLHFMSLLGATENVDISKISLRFPSMLAGGQEFLHCECVRALISERYLFWLHGVSTGQIPIEQMNSELGASLDDLLSLTEFNELAVSSLEEVRTVMIDHYTRQHQEVVERSKSQLNACGFFSEDIPLLTANVEAWSARLHSGHWFLALMHSHVQKTAMAAEIPPDDSEGLRLVICTLLFTFLAATTCFLIGPADLYCYLCELFHTGYFKEPFVYQCLGIFLRDCLSKQKKVVFRLPWQGATFTSFYSSLVDRFNSHSYGDMLFAHYLLLPIAKGNDSDLVAALFSSEQPTDSFIANLVGTLNIDLIGPIEVSEDKKEVEALAKVLQSSTRRGSILRELALKRLGIE